MGKRKIEIEEIKDDRQKRSVTFTKRRDGLFKKAETACQKFGGLQIGIVAFSPAGKPFTFTNSSSSLSVDQIIDTYMSSCSSTCTTSSAVVMGKRRSRSDEDVQMIETEKKKKQKTMMNIVTSPPPPCSSITVEEEQELRRNEFIIMGYGDQNNETGGESSHHFLVEEEEEEGNTTYYSWAPPEVVQLQEIINIEDDDDETTTMGLLPPPPHTTTTTTFTSVCNSIMSASDVNEVGGGANDYEDDDGFTLEEWENILNSSSPNTVVGDSTDAGHSTLWSSSCLNQEEVPAAWPTQDFHQLLCS